MGLIKGFFFILMCLILHSARTVQKMCAGSQNAKLAHDKLANANK